MSNLHKKIDLRITVGQLNMVIEGLDETGKTFVKHRNGKTKKHGKRLLDLAAKLRIRTKEQQ